MIDDKETTPFATISLAAAAALATQQDADFEIYLPTPTQKEPVLYRKGGTTVTLPDFDRIADNGIDTLFIRQEDLFRCERSLEEQLDEILGDPTIPPTDKAEVVHSAGRSVARDLMESPQSQDGFHRTGKIVDTLIDSVLHDPAISSSLLLMAAHERATASHMFLVSTLAATLCAEAYGDDRELLRDVGFAGMLHDMGKLSIPVEILNKPSKLTREETQIVQHHPIESVRLIGDAPNVSAAAKQMILQHHERLDGKGYPLGLSEPDILIGSRILTIVDSFHAMIGQRTYRSALTIDEANRILVAQRGKQFDSELLDIWIDLCTRCTEDSAFKRAQALGPESDEISTRHEHRPVAPPSAVQAQRPRRFDCKNRAMIQCVYAGRLKDATEMPREFSAMMRDLSRGGLSLIVAHPMYRGEILHVQMRIGKGTAWVRCKVAWCQQQKSYSYVIGLKFTERIDETEAFDRSEIESAIVVSAPPPPPELAAQETLNADCTPSAPAPVRTRLTASQQAAQQLTAISAQRKITAEHEHVVVTLATSGDMKTRLHAIDLLGQIKSRETKFALVALLDDTNAKIRERVISLVATHRISEATDSLHKLLKDTDRRAALSAAGALGAMGDPDGLAMVAAVLRTDSRDARLAAKALGDIVGHRFPANQEGLHAARRYAEAKGIISKGKKRINKQRASAS